MMKYFKFLIVGIVFGIILIKSEAVSWYRIYEMFRFESFHMYGIIGTAVFSGILILQIYKRFPLNSIDGKPLIVPPKNKGTTRYLLGGIFFGLGWAMIGACPGPMYALLGTGVFSMAIVIAAAIFGTFVHGVLRKKLPH